MLKLASGHPAGWNQDLNPSSMTPDSVVLTVELICFCTKVETRIQRFERVLVLKALTF